VPEICGPDLDRTEALRHEALEFIWAVSTGSRPFTDGEVVQLLEAATASMKGKRHAG
jgi:hypothetical protein